MRLSELRPAFLKLLDQRTRRYEGVTREEADGIQFLCPKCWTANGGPKGTHMVVCWRPTVPAETTPGPGRWELVGTDFEDLSLVAGSSSVLLLGGCKAHFFVEHGSIRQVG